MLHFTLTVLLYVEQRLAPLDVIIFLVIICDQIWENPPYGIFFENQVCNTFHKHYLRTTNLCPSLKLTVHLVFKIERSLYNRARTIEIKKLWPKCVATYVCGVTVYYAYMHLQLS